MGKISTYAQVSSPSLSDKVIGTNVLSMDATKNFTIADILSLGSSSGLLVPYVGATGAVNLGSNNITANSFIKVGGLSAQFLKADGSVDTNTYLTASTIQFTQVLNGFSTVAQDPSALNTPLIVSFGAAQGGPLTDIELLTGGKIIFNTSGQYFINAYGNVERQGSSGGVAVVLFRAVLNGTQISTTKGFRMDTPNLPDPYEVSIPFYANAGDIFWFEIMRDSSGVNSGGVYPHVNLGGWSNVPSTQVQIWKLN
tara:strand:+ start:3364 stop:4125 length:762 start_codon:yes stop_codon:yes gene_type:complete